MVLGASFAPWPLLCSPSAALTSSVLRRAKRKILKKSLPTAINELLLRILIFYIGTMVVLMSLAPWDKVGLEASPFVQIF